MSIADRLAALTPDQRAVFEKLLKKQREAARAPRTAPPVLPVPRDRDLPLSFAQQRLWLIDQIDPGSPAYNVPLALRLDGEIQPRLLQRVFSEIVRRHESLRTTFVTREAGPVQVIASPEPLDLSLFDLSDLPEKERESQAQDLAFAEVRRPFDLRRGPLLRLLLVRLAERRHLLLLTMHHIVTDGWSMGILVREITALYTAFVEGRPSPLPELPVQYADFAVWQRAWLRDTVLKEQLDWWKPRLADAPAPLELPMESSRPAVLTSRGEAAERLLSPEVCRQMEELGRREGTTPFITLLAALSALLHRYTGQDDIVLGTPVAGRTRVETEGLIGFFLNTLALRIDLSGNPTARELLGRVRETTLGSSNHQEVPFDLILEEIRPERDLSRTPLFQIVLNWLGFGAGHQPVKLPGLFLEQLPEVSPLAKVDLEIYASPHAGQIFLRAVYNRDLFAPFQIEDLLTHLEAILAGMAAGPDRRLAELPPTVEQGEIRRSPIAAAGSAFPIEVLDCSIPERFAALATVHASRPAVVTPEGAWTYSELARKVDGVAHALLARCHTRGERIALLFSPGPSMVASMLGVLAAGATYVPLDPSHPRERLLDVLADCKATVLLAGDDQRVRAEEIRAGLSVLFFGDLPPIPSGWAPPQVAPEELAYLLYTSGSTGRPKGVLQSHRNVLGHIRTYSLRLGLGPEDRLLLLARYGFDAAVMDVYGALLNGATLCIWDLKSDGLEGLGRWIAEQAVTVYHSTPSVYRALLDSVGPGESWPDLRLVVLGGEEARRQDFERFREAFPPGCHLVNGLGPTESTLALQRFLNRDERLTRAGLPIGWPVEEVRVRLRQGGGEQPTTWGVGEIEICSSYLAVGYWGQPDLTAERFVPDPEGLPGSRLYRTGDLARRLPEGELEFLGRMDGQVKVRGYRIETGEIEAALVALSGVRQAVLVAREARFESDSNDRRLVAYVVGDVAVDVLRSSLQSRLPDYMVPAAFVILPALPLTPNGKVDRSALPAPEWQHQEETYLAPRSPVEEVLAGIWAGLLGCERVGVTDDFFGLGGHSLLATQAMSRLRNAFDVEMPLRDLFEAPKLKDFAARVEMALGTRGAPPAPPLIPIPRGGPLPLSFAQQRLWFLDQLEPGRAVYNMPVALRVEGPLDHAVLASCFSEIVRRHEALRTVFVQQKGEPVQAPQPAVPFRLAFVDLSGLPESNREAMALTLTSEETARPFDLAKGPLLRALLLRLTQADHIATLTLHHIVSDGWSMGILVREVVALYAAFAEGRPSPLPALPLQYADFAVWQRSWLQGEVLESQLDYWKRRLAGSATVLELPIDRPRPSIQSFRGATRALPLGPTFSEAVRDLCRREGTTPFMALLAAWAGLLGRHTGQDDVLVGSPIAGRNRQEIEGLIGFFANTLVMRSDLSGNPSFDELLRRVRRSSLDAFAHQDLPFERIVEEIVVERNMALSPLFQVLFVLQNAPRGTLAVPGLAISPLDLRASLAKFDLSLFLAEAENGLWGALEFAADLFDVATVDRLGAQFRTLLEGGMADPQRRLSELPLLPESELHQVLLEWNDVPSQEGSVYVHHLVEAQALRRPEGTATLTPDGNEISYGQLDRMVNRLASALRALGVRPDDRVGVCLERSWEGGVALLAILKAGGCYLPLDPAYPHDRLAFMLADAMAEVIVTRIGLTINLSSQGIRILALDDFWEVSEREERGRGELSVISPDQLSYIIYTSGSTGQPKGVALPHRTLANLIAWQIAVSAAPLGRTLQFASPSFDVSLQEALATWSAGGTLVLIEEEERRDAEALLRRLCEARVERLFLPFVALQQLAEAAFFAASLPPLREVVTAGEQLKITPEVRALFSRLPGCVLRNQYGPSETHVVTEASLWNERPGDVADWPTLPPIGRPIAATEVHLLDFEGVPVPISVPGEIYLGGEGVARGYLGRPDLTAARFIPNPWGRQGGRLYRTGDLARRRPSGEIEFLGRIDHQVKIRGFRVEPGEVEAALAALPGAREAVVVARKDTSGHQRLVAYVVGDVEADALRRSLRERLPDYMVPAAFVLLPELPLTANGKVDRRALPAPDGPRADSGDLAPRTPVEEILAGIWTEVLGLERVGVNDQFFDLGGHSLLATRVMSRLPGAFGIEMPLRDLFEAPTLADFAARIETALRANAGQLAPPLVPVAPALRQGPLPLSFAQQRLWFIDQLDPGSPVYNIPAALRVTGPLEAPVLALCLSEVVRRHEALRTVFAASEGSPVQIIRPASPVALPIVDLSALPAGDREAAALTLAGEEALRPFDLTCDVLVRSLLLRIAEGNHIVLLTMHHIASDGWSMGVLINEVTALYAASTQNLPSPLPELPVQYADFAVWQRSWLQGEVLHAQLDHWKRRLAGAPAVLELPLDRPRPGGQTFRGASRPLRFEPGLSDAVRELCRGEGVTPFMALLAAWAVLLGRHAGQDDVLVGAPIAGRDRREIEGLIGFFVNTLVLRSDLSGNPSFAELLDRVRRTALDAFTYQDLPFERIVEEVVVERNRAISPLFQAFFALQNAPRQDLTVPGLVVSPLDVSTGLTKFDLSLNLLDGPAGLVGMLEHNSDLFDGSTAERLSSRFMALLEAAVEDPSLSVADLPIFLSGERQQALVEWNDTRFPFSSACLHELVEAQVDRTPEAVAIIAGNECLTYGELDRRANHMAHHLRSLGVGPDVLVGLCAERSPQMVIGMLGILKAGGAYVPIDPEYPRERLAFLVEDSGLRVLLAQQDLAGQLPSGEIDVVFLDGTEKIEGVSDRRPAGGALPESLAYVIYTSGSTGLPKGVLVPHGGVVNRLLWAQQMYPVTSADRVLHKASFSFDFSVWECFGPLIAGAQLILARPGEQRDVALLIRTIQERKITMVHFIPSMLQMFVAEKGAEACTSLRYVFSGGEALSLDLQERCLARVPAVLRNQYGPTEISIDTTDWVCRPEDTRRGFVPLGFPLANTALYVLDERLSPVPPGVAGELCVGGAGVTRGYGRRPDLTAEKFVPDPFSGSLGARLYRTGDRALRLPDGNVKFLGRIDHQVKIRGFRIEPGEIETALASHPSVRECVLLVREDAPGSRLLVAYAVLHPEAGFPDLPTLKPDLRGYLEERLPELMMPSAIVILDALPLLPNGKVDRRMLPAPEWSTAVSATAPRTPVEEVLTGIFAEVLGLERIGVEDDFFALGGHSLLATRLVSRLREVFGRELPVRLVFEAPTVAELAARIGLLREGPSAPPVRPVPRDRELPLSFAQQRLWFIDQIEPGSPAYNVPLALRLTGTIDLALLERIFSEIVRRHEALRTTFASSEGAPVQVIASVAPLELRLIDLSCLPEAEREARALVASEAGRPFDLQRGPLLRLLLVRLADADHLLLLCLHHIVSDGWSMGVLLREITTLQEAFSQGLPSPLAELPVQYADFAVWQRTWLAGEVLDAQLAYWQRRLAGAPAVLELPLDHPRPLVQSYRGATRPLHLGPVLSDAVGELSRREGATPFMVLLAAWALLLGRHAGQDDVLVGSPIAGRTRREIEGLIGFFVNTLVLRSDLSGNPTFAGLLGRVRQTALDAFTHQDLPFERLVEDLAPERSLAHSPLFQVLFVLQNAPMGDLNVPGLTLSPVDVNPGIAKFDLSLFLSDAGDGLAGALEFATDLFDAATVDRLWNHFRTLLESALADPRRHLAELALVPAGERHQILWEWNDVPDLDGSACVHHLVEAQARRTPDAAAVLTAEGREISYRELDRLAEGLALRLQGLGVRLDDRVGVCLERSWEGVVALLAILKAGGCYLPLDPAYPQERLRFMLSDAAASVIVTRDGLPTALPSEGVRVLSLDAFRDGGWPEEGRGADLPAVGLDHLSYAIYTSGSTGRPKGVALPHRTLANLIAWQIAASAAPAARTLQFASPSFDVSLQETLATWAGGGTLVLLCEDDRRDAEAVLRRLCEARVERLFLPFVALQQLAEVASRADALPPLREVVTAGEQLQVTPEVRALFSRLPGCVLRNQYGPSETHVVTEASLGNERRGEVEEWPILPSIGRPVAGTKVHLLDFQGAPVSIGGPGEIWLGGMGLARGYLDRPDLTAARFVPDPWGWGRRLYRTGDLARRRSSGEIEFLGRIDHQVKIRGFRIELREIEAALATHPAVREAVVVVRGEGAAKRLVACIVPADGLPQPADALRAHLRDRLPDYMVPGAFMTVESFPLTASGKVDRRALALSPEPRPAASAGAPPRTPVEELLAGIWGEVLGIERVEVDESFFALGGHSLLATQVMSRIRGVFGTDLPVRQLFESPTIAELARAVQQAGSTLQAPPILPVPRNRDLPVSFAQQRLWLLDQLEPGNPAYNLPMALRLSGEIEPGLLARIFSEIVRRHEALRTTFASRDDGPVQVIAPPTPLALPLLDLSHLPEDEREAQARALALAEARRPFDLQRGPLLRLLLLRLAGTDWLLLLTMHHIVSDGWSLGVLVREVTALHEAFAQGLPSPLPELPVQYADFAAWQRSWLQGEALDAQLGHWKRRLAGAPALLELPLDRPRPTVQSYRGARCPVVLSFPLSEAIGRLCRQQGITPFMAFLAGWAVLLGRHAGQDDVLVGAPIAGRNRREIESLIGFFINTLVLRADLSGNPSLADLLGQVRRTALDAFAHQDLPFERLVEELAPERSLAHTPLFQVMLVLQNAPMGDLVVPGLALSPIDLDAGLAKLDLSLTLFESPDGFTGVVTYAADLFDPSTVERLAARFQTLLSGMAAAGLQDACGAPLHDLEVLSETERRQLLVDWSAAEERISALSLHEMVERQAERTPDAVAVIFEAERWSYRDLVRRSREIAASLRGQGVGPGDRVAILDQRSAERVARVLGVLASGATYVAIDSEQPQAWRARILADLAPVRVLPPREATLHDPEPSSRDSESRLLAIGGELPGYVVYTSGSTGRPKGIVAHHRGAATYLEWVIRNYGLAESDVALQLAPLTFDASLRDTLAPLAAGGRIVIVPEGVVRDPAALLERIAAHGVTCLPSIVPSLLRLLVEEALASGRTFPSLRLILASGEKLHGVDAAAVRRAFGEKVGLVNQYGPSEATMTSTWYPVTAADESLPALPVGRPAASARVFLLDRALRPVPPGAAGEICLGGPGLAFGYLGQPDRTAEVFIPDPFGAPGDRLYRTGDRGRHRPDGVLELLGRIDLQVKIRGQRVEPGEIEAMLRSHPEVREAVVAALGEGEPRLAAWLVADGTGADDLRAFLAERLPASMVPADWAFLDALPLTLHGKVDRSRLPDPGRERRAVQEPRDRIELRLVRLWEEILGIPAIGVSDNFFALGGHSLAAVRLMAGIRRLFGRELPLAELFQRPTIEALAELLRRNERDLPWSPLVALTPGCAEKAPLFCIHGADGHALTFGDFARALSEAGEDRPVFALEARGLADGQEPLQSIEEMADLYLAAIREVRPRGPYRLLGYSMGSKIAFTMARELERAGETVEQLVLVDIPTLPRAEVLPPPEIPENLRALPDFDAELAGRHVAVWTANQEASRLWRAAPYKGKALLIVAEDGVCAGAADPALGWGAVAEGGVEVVSCPGDHFTLFRPPYVETLAERIRTGGTGMKDRASSPGTQVGGSPAEK